MAQATEHGRNMQGLWLGERVCATEEDAEITAIRASGKSIRETAGEAGCSVGDVQDVLRELEGGCMEIN